MKLALDPPQAISRVNVVLVSDVSETLTVCIISGCYDQCCVRSLYFCLFNCKNSVKLNVTMSVHHDMEKRISTQGVFLSWAFDGGKRLASLLGRSVTLGKFLLAVASTVIFGSESRWTHDNILLHDSGSHATLA